MVKAEKKMQKVGVTELAKFHPLGTKLRAEKTQFSPDIAVQCLCAFWTTHLILFLNMSVNRLL